MSHKLHGKTNEMIREKFKEKPDFVLTCKLGKILNERGLKMQELSDLTGIRVATISELVNMKRSTINISHLLLIAKTLGIKDISELLEFKMSESTKEQFTKDQATIENNGLLLHQEELLYKKRKHRKNPPSS